MTPRRRHPQLLQRRPRRRRSPSPLSPWVPRKRRSIGTRRSTSRNHSRRDRRSATSQGSTTLTGGAGIDTLTGGAGYAIGTPGTATVTVVSDDVPPDLLVSPASTTPIGGADADLVVTDLTWNQGAGTADNVNSHCLSCHDGDTTKIRIGGSPDPQNINTRWTNSGTAKYSKYDPNYFNVVPQLTKAYSPHRYPGTNIAKKAGDGTDANMSAYEYDASRIVSDARPVACLDCHPAHGSPLGSGWDNGAGYNRNANLRPVPQGGVMLVGKRPGRKLSPH